MCWMERVWSQGRQHGRSEWRHTWLQRNHLSIMIKPLSSDVLVHLSLHRVNTKQSLSVPYPLYTFYMHFTCTHVCVSLGKTWTRNDRTSTLHGAVQRTWDVLNVRCHTHVVHGHGVRRRCSDGITYPTLGRPPIPPLKELPNLPISSGGVGGLCPQTPPLHPDKDNGVMLALACYVTHQICTWSKMRRYPERTHLLLGRFVKKRYPRSVCNPKDCLVGVSGKKDPFNNCDL